MNSSGFSGFSAGTKVFYIDSTGAKIGSFNIDSSSISTGAYNTLNTMYLGTSGLSLSNTFRVTWAGLLYATAGALGGCSLSSTKLIAGNINIDSAGSINTNYTEGCSGWSIKNDGSAEFNYILVRGTIYSTAGTIGNFNISASSIQTGAFNTLNTLYFGSSGLSLSNIFSVTPQGALTASNVKITGGQISIKGTSAGYNQEVSLSGGALQVYQKCTVGKRLRTGNL